MVSLVELVGSSFICFLLFTVTLIALWSYVIFTKGTAQPIDPNVFKKDDSVMGKRTAKNRSKNKWQGNLERKQESREQVGNKPQLPEAKNTHQKTKHTSAENTTDIVPQANVDPAPSKVDASRSNDVVSGNNSLRSKQKGKRKTASRQEQQEEKDVPFSSDDAEGGWKVQLSRQQQRVLKEQQRQAQHNSHGRQHEAIQEKETMATPPNENQSGSEDMAVLTADKAVDGSLTPRVEVSVHCDNPLDIERALKEAVDSSSSPEGIETPTAWGSQQHKKRMRQKDKPDPPIAEQPSDQAKEDLGQEDWVIL